MRSGQTRVQFSLLISATKPGTQYVRTCVPAHMYQHDTADYKSQLTAISPYIIENARETVS